MHSRYYLSGLAGLALLMSATSARSEPVTRVGLVVDAAVNLSPEQSTDLSERLGQALRDALLVDVTAGREVARRLGVHERDADCFRNRDCQVSVASVLEVEQLIVLVAVRVGTRLQIEPTWIDVGTGRTVVRDALVMDSDEQAQDAAFKAAAARLLPDAPRREASPAINVAPTVQVVQTATVGAQSIVPTATWVAFGVAGAAIVVGAAVGLSASADHGDLETMGCARMPCDPAKIDAVQSKALVADVLFGTAGTALVAGLAYWWWQSSAPADLAIVPSVNVDGAQCVLRGRF